MSAKLDSAKVVELTAQMRKVLVRGDGSRNEALFAVAGLATEVIGNGFLKEDRADMLDWLHSAIGDMLEGVPADLGYPL